MKDGTFCQQQRVVLCGTLVLLLGMRARDAARIFLALMIGVGVCAARRAGETQLIRKQSN